MNGLAIKQYLESFGITPESNTHRANAIVVLRYAKEETSITKIIKQHGGLWSQTLGSWYINRNKTLLVKIIKDIAALKGIDIEKEELKQMERVLQLKSYSPNTINNYNQGFSLFLVYYWEKEIATITKKEIEDYLLYLKKEKKLSETAIHSSINSIKFYYEQVLKKPRTIYEVERPKKPIQNPKVFSKEEIEKMLNVTTNLKHKTILMVCYSSGLRISEVVSLKVKEIDSKRMVLNILASKGKKDRIVPLSKVTLKYLRAYYETYKPKEYIFEGQDGKEAYSTRSIQKILAIAKEKAGIIKAGSVHTLRHSYATHLLDRGVDITYIQKILGHNDLKTTLRYLHVTNRDLMKIESPLDDLEV